MSDKSPATEPVIPISDCHENANSNLLRLEATDKALAD